MSVLRVGFIGDGAIARSVRQVLATRPDIVVVGILAHDSPAAPIYAASFEDLMARNPSVIVECAGHEALKAYGTQVLRGGLGLVIASIGALADTAIETALYAAEAEGGGTMILPSGALSGLDGLAAAKLDGLSRVTYTGRKPPHAWRGTPAESQFDLDALMTPTVIFDGNARDAALTFPKNANVAATVALFGIGFEATKVRILADPGISRNVHELSYEGPFGICTVTIAGEPSPDNPKTSRLTAYSIARRVIDRAAMEPATTEPATVGLA